MEKKKSPGRPSFSASRRRTQGVTVLLTRAERKVIEGLAMGKPLSAYLREKGLAS